VKVPCLSITELPQPMNACAAMEIQMEIQMEIRMYIVQHIFDIKTRNIADKQFLKRFTAPPPRVPWDVCCAAFSIDFF
jgi:hypothetical protein